MAVGIGTDPKALLIPGASAGTCAFTLSLGAPPSASVFGIGAVGIVETARGGVFPDFVAALITVSTGPARALGLVTR